MNRSNYFYEVQIQLQIKNFKILNYFLKILFDIHGKIKFINLNFVYKK